MEFITVTFPDCIPPDLIIELMPQGVKNVSQYRCIAEFVEHDGVENVYRLHAEEKDAFYILGMVAASIIDNVNKRLSAKALKN